MQNDTQHPISDNLLQYIEQSSQGGLSPDEIANGLRQAGWAEATIQQAFKAVHNRNMPPPPSDNMVPDQSNASPSKTGQPQQSSAVATGSSRGRFKTGWLLLKQSLKVLRTNKDLVRYIFMSTVLGILLTIVFAVILVLGRHVFLRSASIYNNNRAGLAPAGYLVALVYYVLAYFIANLYSAGLAANALDLFRGHAGPYREYMQKARAKSGKLFVFSLIEATVGLILRAIAERSRLIGRIVVAIFGALWSLARLFVIPIIVTSDENALEAIKHSTLLLKATWGENLIGRVTFGLVLFVIYLIMIPVSILLLVVGGGLGGGIGIAIALFLVVVMYLAVGLIASAASSVLNTALFYFAQYKQVPSAFDAELLNRVFIPRTRNIFGRRIKS